MKQAEVDAIFSKVARSLCSGLPICHDLNADDAVAYRCGEVEVNEVKRVVDDMNRRGWCAPPALVYNCPYDGNEPGTLTVVSGHKLVIAACLLGITPRQIKIDNEQLIAQLEDLDSPDGAHEILLDTAYSNVYMASTLWREGIPRCEQAVVLAKAAGLDPKDVNVTGGPEGMGDMVFGAGTERFGVDVVEQKVFASAKESEEVAFQVYGAIGELCQMLNFINQEGGETLERCQDRALAAQHMDRVVKLVPQHSKHYGRMVEASDVVNSQASRLLSQQNKSSVGSGM